MITSLIRQDASLKSFNALLRDFRPELLLASKFTSDSGYYTEIARLYSTMFHEWSALQKDVSDTMEAVSSLEWTITPYADTGARPTPQAQDAADTVRRAIWHTTAQAPGAYSHSFTELTGAMLDAIYRGASVHEIIWQRTAELVYPVEYRQIAPQHYIWETRTGHEDRLLLVRDGISYSEPEPFPAHKFIIALNTTGSDHPIYNALFYSLIGYFAAAKFGLPWLQQYCKRYGHPVFKFNCNTEEDIAKLKQQLKESDDLYSVFLLNEGEMDVTAMPSGASIPHETLLRIAENACHQAILGQTLTSDTSQNGGSRAQAEVHMGVQKSIVMKRAEYVARVLNRQLIPAIIAMNYGSAQNVPMPELKFTLPDDGANIERAEFWGKVLALPGITVPRETVYESLRLPIPQEGDDTLGSTSDEGRRTKEEENDAEDVKKNASADEGGVKAAHCNQYGHAPGCMIGEEGQRVYTTTPGKEKELPGNIPLFSGYVANELGHGELADLHALSDFLDSSPVGSVADHFFPRQGVKAKELAAHIAAVYREAGVSALHVEPVGEVLLDRKGIVNSMAHYAQNKWTTPEHKQRVTDAFALVPAVLQKGALVEYGQQMDNKLLTSYIYLAPVQIGEKSCIMAVRIKKAQGQLARFYLHGIALADELKEKSRGCRDQGSGLDTGNPSGADPRDVFRVAKKAYAVKLKDATAQAARRLVYCRQSKTAKFAADAPKSNKASELLRAAIGGGFTENIPTREDVVKRKNDIEMQAARRATGSSSALLAELAMREYLRPLAAALRDAKKRGESYAAIKKRLATPLTAAATLSHGLAAAFNTGRALPQGDVAAANPYGCNQYGEGWAEPHDGNSTGYQQMGPGKPKRKVLTTEHGGNKVEKVTHDKHPGKGAYEHADNDTLDKTAKEEREKREREKAAQNTGAGVDAFAERIEKAVDKATADRFREQMANAPEEARALFEKYKGEIEIQTTSNGSYCIMKIPPLVALDTRNNNASGWYRVPGQSLLHEIGHALDRHAGNSRYNLSPQLQESIDADVKDVFARKRKELEAEKGRKVRINEIRNALADELNTLKTGLAPVTDAFGAHGVHAVLHHTKNYFKTRPGAGHSETFANLYAAHTIQDKNMIESAKKYLPRTYDRFINILKKHTKGGNHD